MDLNPNEIDGYMMQVLYHIAIPDLNFGTNSLQMNNKESSSKSRNFTGNCACFKAD